MAKLLLPLRFFLVLAASWGCAGAGLAEAPTVESLATGPVLGEPAPAALTACSVDGRSLCLGDKGRFRASLSWQGFQGPVTQAQALPLTADAGVFWFFSAGDPDVVVKVLDGTAVNGHFWVFYGGLTSFRYQLVITDTQTNTVKSYPNPLGQLRSFADMLAFPAVRAGGAEAAEPLNAPLELDSALKAAFSFHPTSPDVGQPITFTVTSPSSPSNLAELCWDYDLKASGGGTSCPAQNSRECDDSGNPAPQHRYTTAGPRCVQLTVSDGTTTTTSPGALIVVSACAVTGTVKPLSFGPKGGTGVLSVSAPAGCSWQAQATSASGFLRFLPLSGNGGTSISGNGKADIAFTVDENVNLTSRRSTITIDGSQFTVTEGTDHLVGPCVPDSEVLCLLNRFEVRVSGPSFGSGRVVALAENSSGYVTFADPANVELMVKILDGTSQNGHLWFYSGALTDVGYTIIVRDSLIGFIKSYSALPGGYVSRVDKGTF
jgi:PKD repeat protein